MRYTKIIATLGPASDAAATIDALIAAGADVFRLNFSHGTRCRARGAVRAGARGGGARRRAGGRSCRTCPAPRSGPAGSKAARRCSCSPGDTLVMEIGDGVGGPGRVFTTYAPLAAALAPGHRLLLDDGYIELRVEGVSGSRITTTVVDGGPLGERKGINAPGVPLPAAGLTEKDARDLAFGLALGVDLVAMSFVQRAADLQAARAAIVRERGVRPCRWSPKSSGPKRSNGSTRSWPPPTA